MSIKKTAIPYCLTFALVGIICNIIPNLLRGDVLANLNVLGFFCTFELIAFCVINTILHGTLMNYGTLFSVILYVFHFGQLVLYSFFRDIYPHVRILRLLEAEEVLYGFHCMHAVFTAICLGMLLSFLKSDENIISTRAKLRNQQHDFVQVAKQIIYVTFPFKLFIDVVSVFLCLTAGGPVAREWVNTFPNVFLFIGKVSLVGFAVLLVALREDPQKQNRLFLAIEAYILAMMVSGIRSENVGYVCVIALLYFTSKKKKTNFLQIFLLAGAAVVALAFVVAVGELRDLQDKTLQAYVDLFVSYLTHKNVVFHLLNTCGDTGYTAQCVVNKWLPEYGAVSGSSYCLGLVAIIPNIPGILTFPGEITEASCFPIRLQEAGTLAPGYLNIGGSLIGELFFNFGVFAAPFFALLLGLWIGRVSYKCKVYIEQGHYYGLLWVVPVMYAVTYWVRHYFGGQIREIVWGPLISIAVMKVFDFIQKKKRCNRK